MAKNAARTAALGSPVVVVVNGGSVVVLDSGRVVVELLVGAVVEEVVLLGDTVEVAVTDAEVRDGLLVAAVVVFDTVVEELDDKV